MRISGPKRLATAAVLSAGLLLMACGGEDRPGVDVIDDGSSGGSASVSGIGAPSTGASADGYQPVSDVDTYFAMAADLRDVRAIMQPATEGNAVDWEAASEIYEDGLNQKGSDGALRPLAAIPNESVYAIFPNGAEVFGSEDFISDLIRDGLHGTGIAEGFSDTARRQVVDKGIQMLLYAKSLQEMASASTRVAEGNTDDASGAPHAVDEAYAVAAGPTEADGSLPHSLFSTASSREGNFGLDGLLRGPLEEAFIDALAAARVGDVDDFENAHARVRGYLNGIFYLASLRYVSSLVSDETAEDREVHLAEGRTFFQTIRALVASGSTESADTIEGVYTRSAEEEFPATLAQEVYDAMNEDTVRTALDLPGELVVRTPPQ